MACQGLANRIGESGQFVAFQWKDQSRFECLGLFDGHQSIGDDDDHIANSHSAGGGTVEADHTRTSFAFDDIGFESFTIVVVDNLDTLSFHQIGRIDEVFIYGNTAHVIEVCLRNDSPVNLRFETLYLHSSTKIQSFADKGHSRYKTNKSLKIKPLSKHY